MNKQEILTWVFRLWFIIFPLIIFIVYTIVTELLDLFLNTFKINKLLKNSDSLKPSQYIEQYTLDKNRQLNLNSSHLLELDRRIKYIRHFRIKVNRSIQIDYEERERISSAKNISDVFKIT